MNVPFLVAKRYFISKKKKNIINIISIISMISVAVGTAALIIVLSVFNGLEDLIRSIYGSFDPDLKISAVEGRSFAVDEAFLGQVTQTPGVAMLTEVIEDNAVLRYNERQMVVKMKGVSDNFFEQNQIDSAIVEGSHQLVQGEELFALIGRGIQYQLSVRPESRFAALQFMYPKVTKGIPLNPENAFRELSIMPGGVFAIERQYDDSYVFVPLDFAQELLDYGDRRSSLEVKVRPDYNINRVQRQLREALGPEFLVQNSDEQHVSLLRAVKVEKMFVFITFTFILLIASINIFYSLSMLVIDKKRDIAILASMGASAATVRQIFLAEGAIIAFSGAFTGIALGLFICWLQQTFGLVSMGMATSVVDSYPVKMQLSDILFTGASIVLITMLVSVRPAYKAADLSVRENL